MKMGRMMGLTVAIVLTGLCLVGLVRLGAVAADGGYTYPDPNDYFDPNWMSTYPDPGESPGDPNMPPPWDLVAPTSEPVDESEPQPVLVSIMAAADAAETPETELASVADTALEQHPIEAQKAEPVVPAELPRTGGEG